ncbi:MAG: hypothetical protein ACT4PZ_20955 [Panacagrimonas sp.]
MPAEKPPSPCRFRALLRTASLLTGLTLVSALLPSPAYSSDRLFPGLQKVLLPMPMQDASTRYSKSQDSEGRYRISADFRSLSGDPMSISFMIEQAASRASMQEFGISRAELDAVTLACRASKDCDRAELERRVHGYYREHKLNLKIVPGKPLRLSVDIPEIVRRNQAHVRPVAAALQQLGSERGRDSEWILEAAVALVQAGLEYRLPSSLESGRQTLGFYTPPHALEKGYGDCDTKSALLAAILLNLGDSRIIGVRVPQHYLLGIARTPRPGEAYLDYEGEPYVLVEAAGPARRRPGDVATATRVALDRSDPIRIDPMF